MNHSEVEDCVTKELQGRRGVGVAIERWDLVQRVFGPGADIPRTDRNRADRAIRKAIDVLRSRGMLICNLGEGSGWFLPATAEEYENFRAVYGSHAFPILKNIREMDRSARRIWPNALQPKLL